MKLKRTLLAIAGVTACFAFSASAMADLKLATEKNCMSCHAVDKKVLGPSFKDVAAKYADKKDAVDKLAIKVIKGGGGVWGTIVSMPANTQVSPDEAKKLVAWILAQK